MLTVKNSKTFDFKNISLQDCAYGNALDAFYTARIYLKLLDEIKEKNVEKLYDKLISPLSKVLLDIEYEGLLIDTDKLQEIKISLNSKIENLYHELTSSEFIPDDINLGSSKQLAETLFSLRKSDNGEWEIDESKGLGLYPINWTAKGQPSTDEESIVKIADMISKEMKNRGFDVE